MTEKHGMHSENPKGRAPERPHPQGSTDLSEKQLRNFASIWSTKTTTDRKLLEKAMAKTFGITPQELVERACTLTIDAIKRTEQGALLHYHQSSLHHFEQVLERGGTLLSSRELEQRFGIRGPWTANPDGVMMTRDCYDQAGTLQKPGVSLFGIGASSDEITYVFHPSIMNTRGYNPMGHYPASPEIPLHDHLAAILVRKHEHAPLVTERLSLAGFNQVPVIPRDAWIHTHYPPQAPVRRGRRQPDL